MPIGGGPIGGSPIGGSPQQGSGGGPLVTENLVSLIGFGFPIRLSLPVADGSLSQGDRQHLVGLFAGILLTEVVAATDKLIGSLQFTIAVEGRLELAPAVIQGQLEVASATEGRLTY